ncbi:uncharacterized protein LOC108623868 [Ceratina calcarata]|uniref:Uncharacterized protein LOC108623868 n=1 Tax=Ceratina calcarata TaxID=156304 RepID=A0AAJ7IWA6_9HYME|nr:uncharacterized protein LOC108623868 [Ceratina calcarata]
MNENELTWANERAEPTFATRDRSEVLDVTIISANDKTAINGWRVMDDPSLSDHKFVSYRLTGNGLTTFRVANVTRSLDKERYLKTLEENLREAPTRYGTPSEIDEYTDFITNAVKNAENVAVSNKRRGFNPKLPWWNPDLDATRLTCKRLRTKAQRTKTRRNKLNAKRAESKFKKEIAEAKRNTWKRICGRLQKAQDIARMNKILESTDEKSVGLVQKPDGTMTRNLRESIETLDHETPRITTQTRTRKVRRTANEHVTPAQTGER